jgi:parvulin-like peptidyl-prolyl isomerase
MSKKTGAPVAPTRKHLARAERERRQKRAIIYGVIAVAVVVVAVIGFGFFDQLVIQPRQPVARVSGTAISLGDFQKAVRYQRYLIITQQYQQLVRLATIFGSDAQSLQYYQQQISQVQSYLADSETLGRQVLNNLVDDQIIRQEAARRGITVSKEEVDARMQETFGFFPNGTVVPSATPTDFPTDVPPTVNPTLAAVWTPTPTLTPTAAASAAPTQTPIATGTAGPTATPFTAQAYATRVTSYTTVLKQSAGLSEADFRHFIESEIYREKLIKVISADVPTTVEQVWARHILISVSDTASDTVKLAAQAKINDLLVKLRNGQDDFANLARQVSEDTGSGAKGGDLGWFKKGDMVAEFEQVAFNTPVGQISDPVKTQFGWHIIQVLGHENRPLTATQIDTARQKAFDDWLQKQRDGADPLGQQIVEILDTWSGKVPTDPVLPTSQ